jgi:glycosyltransferase involved in cell wall biosynthesis
MRVLIYPHDLGMGGSQMNAIELAARVRDLGAETMIFGRPGVLCERIQALGLEFIESPDPGRRPSQRIARQLRTLAQERKIDVLHGYEWPPSLECAVAALGLRGTMAISTVMSMAVPPFIPKTMPLIVGTEQIAQVERTAKRSRTYLLEPPVDLQHNVAPPAVEISAFRRHWEISEESHLIVCITRLAAELKAEGLLSAISAISGELADLPVQMLIVGDGPAREQVTCAVDAANARAGGKRVIMTGELLDPRAAYAAADIVLGMGGSAIRALAFGKPLIVQGERGFFSLLSPETASQFLWQGWYGVGQSIESGCDQFARVARPVLTNVGMRQALARFGRQLAENRYSLDTAAEHQVALYEQAMHDCPSSRCVATSLLNSASRFTSYYIRRKINQIARNIAADDFNAVPVAATGPTWLPRAAAASDERAVVYLAGAPWDAVVGTDRQLATALSRIRPVIWVDPPTSLLSRVRSGKPNVDSVSDVARGITRLHPLAPPGVSRIGIRALAALSAHARVRSYLRRSGREVGAVLASTPEPFLAHWRKARVHRIYFATDDFVAGAALLGISVRYATQARRGNLAAADSVLAVTENLAARLREFHDRVLVFPNGCNPETYENLFKVKPSTTIQLPSPVAGVVGQFNARLDLNCLDAVAATGASLLLVGPRYDRDSDFSRRFDELIARPNVQWIDRRPIDEMPSFMAALRVGLTPYGNNEFNRASFPLKTLEYLSAGLAVVSTELPATQSLDQKLISVVSSPAAFAAATCEALSQAPNKAAIRRRREYAQQHSWDARAAQLINIISRD